MASPVGSPSMLNSQHASLPTIATGAVIVYLVWLLLRKLYVRSPLDNIPGPPSGSIWSGNIMQLFSQNHWDFVRHIAETYGPVAKLHGFFGTTALHTYDLKAMHSIFIKDQESYYRGGETTGTILLLIGPGLLSTHGDRHRKQRKMLNPVFSVAHMRNMAPLFYNVTEKFVAAIKTQVEGGPQEVDMIKWMGRIALELVGQGGMGHSFDPLVEGSQDTLTEAVKALTPSFEDLQWARFLFPYLPYLGPSWFRRAILDLIPSKRIQKVKDITDLVNKRSEELVNAKKAALGKGEEDVMHQVGEGKDVMSILLKGNTMATDEDKLPDEELYAQILTFIFAGIDTTSNSLARILHQVADHQDIQEKLRKEIHEAQERVGQAIPYDELCALPYMDAVCRETLRVFAPVNVVAREVLHDTILPLSNPVRGIDGTNITEIPVQKGTSIFCHVGEANTDKALWGQDAGEWKPERWLKPLPREVEEARIPGIYAHLMTFIGGPYACIGFKFSQLEMKVVLALLLSSFKFERSNTPISWRFGGIAYPTSGEASNKAEMYLVVSRV